MGERNDRSRFLDLGSGKEYNKLNPDRWFTSSQEKQ